MVLKQTGLRFWVGIVLLTTNQPLGWVGMVTCNAIAVKQNSAFFSFLGFGIYALSWVMLGIGAWMAGPQGVQYARQLMLRLFRRQAPDPLQPKSPHTQEISSSTTPAFEARSSEASQ